MKFNELLQIQRYQFGPERKIDFFYHQSRSSLKQNVNIPSEIEVSFHNDDISCLG